MKKLTVLILFFSLMAGRAVRGQHTNAFYLQTYDNSSGLSNSSVNDMLTNTDGLLWLATWDGLNMYDGKNFHVFNHSREKDFKSIGNNVIQTLLEDKQGNMWMTTIEGVSMYEKASGKIFNFFYERQSSSRMSEHEYLIAKDTSSGIYCITQKNAVWKFDQQQKKFVLHSTLPAGEKILKTAFCNDSRLLLLRHNGAFEIYDHLSNRFTLSHISPQKIKNFFIANGNIFLTGYDDTLYRLNAGKTPPALICKTVNPVQAISFYSGHYLISWQEKGFETFDKNFAPTAFMQEIKTQMRDMKITCWSVAPANMLLAGTDGSGMMKIAPRTKNFGTVLNADYGKLYNRPIRAFCKVGSRLWVGTKGSGILTYETTTPVAKPKLVQNITAPLQLDNNAIYVLQKVNNDYIMIGSDGRGFGLFDINKNHFYKWNEISGSGSCPEFGSVYAVLHDADGSLWIGTSGYGLLHLKIDRDKNGKPVVQFIEKFTSANNASGPANDIIYALAAGSNNHLWIGCRYGGLSLLNKRTKKFITHKAFVYEGGLSNNDVLSVYKDKRNLLWIGTSYGLNWVKETKAMQENPVFQKITTADGLPNNTIHGIVEDDSGQMWVSTSRGLATVQLPGVKTASYQQSDGLQNNEFSDGAVWKDEAGRLYFGGISGFNHFLPEDIGTAANLPNLLLSGISMGGKPVRENSFDVFRAQATNTPLSFVIERKNNHFELNLSAISFLNADKSEFAYYLEGYDNQWHYDGAINKIAYSHILPGRYTLKIKWSNGEGLWSGETAVLHLKVKQYAWLTWWALLGYFTVCCLIVYWYFRYRKNKLKVEQQLAVEHLMRTQEEEIHENRISFFTNIAHELQTPLTLITGGIERFLDKAGMSKAEKEKNRYLFLINQQAAKLAYLLQQLFEFRKIETGNHQNQYARFLISELLQQLAEPFAALGEQSGMDYRYDIAPNIAGWTDKDKLEKIIFNLLSNAFKYAGDGAQIRLTAVEENEELCISVANSGVALSAEQLEKLFDSFYTSGNKAAAGKFGTGIGLAFTRQLVQLLNGSITVANENKLIVFTVRLPLHHATAADTPLLEKGNEKPSWLYKVITARPDTIAAPVTTQRNKEAVIATQAEKDKNSILIVEDETEIRHLLRDIFKQEYIIYEAADGQEALALMQKIEPSLIISDVMMPHIDGLTFCERVKNAPATCHIPIILLSAKSTDDQHLEGYEAGADAYISKPFLTKHLTLRVRKLLQYRQRLQQLQQEAGFSGITQNPDIQSSDKAFLAEIFALVEEHIINPELDAAFLEQALCLSKMQLYRRLKTLSGMTPNEFIKNVRLQKAAALLAGTQKTVADVFYSTGFNNQSYFFREFKKKYGCAPGEYREGRGV